MKRDPDNAARAADLVELRVGEVARVRRERVGVRMAGDERRRRKSGNVPEAALVQVSEIDQDAEAVALRHERAAGFCQSAAGVGRRRERERDTFGERVRSAPDQAERAQPPLVEVLEILEIRLDRLGTFEVQNRRERAVVQRGLDLFGGTGYADIAARYKLVQQFDDLTGLASRVCGGHRRGERLRIRWLAF